MNRKELVLTALNRLLKESLHKDQSKRPKASICNYIIDAEGTSVSCVMHGEDELWVCARSWEHCSGSVVYPVPCPDGGSAYVAFCTADYTGSFWVGKYGNSRRAYLRHMIQWVQDNLNESE